MSNTYKPTEAFGLNSAMFLYLYMPSDILINQV